VSDTLRVLFDAQTIAERVRALGAQIAADYRDRDPVLVVTLGGAFVFAADLARAIEMPLRIDFIGAQSYGNATRSSGKVDVTYELARSVEGEDVLLVEDIVETGGTAKTLIELLKSRGARSVELVALLQKRSATASPPAIRYLGLSFEDGFVVGYGLDYAQRHRGLPHIAVLDESS
jgi:hypoxanthine phosphoribosyltransferase